MSGYVQAGGVDALIGLVAVVLWVATNFISARNRQGPRPGAPARPPVCPPNGPSRAPAPPPRSPEEELRDFLEQLSKGVTAGTPEREPVREVEVRPPLPPPPPAQTFRRAARERIRPAVPVRTVPESPVTASAPRVIVHATATPPAPDSKASDVFQKSAGRSSAAFHLPAVALPLMRSTGSMPSMTATSGTHLNAVAIPRPSLRNRRSLKQAIILQTILSPPQSRRF